MYAHGGTESEAPDHMLRDSEIYCIKMEQTPQPECGEIEPTYGYCVITICNISEEEKSIKLADGSGPSSRMQTQLSDREKERAKDIARPVTSRMHTQLKQASSDREKERERRHCIALRKCYGTFKSASSSSSPPAFINYPPLTVHVQNNFRFGGAQSTATAPRSAPTTATPAATPREVEPSATAPPAGALALALVPFAPAEVETFAELDGEAGAVAEAPEAPAEPAAEPDAGEDVNVDARQDETKGKRGGVQERRKERGETSERPGARWKRWDGNSQATDLAALDTADATLETADTALEAAAEPETASLADDCARATAAKARRATAKRMAVGVKGGVKSRGGFWVLWWGGDESWEARKVCGPTLCPRARAALPKMALRAVRSRRARRVGAGPAGTKAQATTWPTAPSAVISPASHASHGAPRRSPTISFARAVDTAALRAVRPGASSDSSSVVALQIQMKPLKTPNVIRHKVFDCTAGYPFALEPEFWQSRLVSRPALVPLSSHNGARFDLRELAVHEDDEAILLCALASLFGLFQAPSLGFCRALDTKNVWRSDAMHRRHSVLPRAYFLFFSVGTQLRCHCAQQPEIQNYVTKRAPKQHVGCASKGLLELGGNLF
ncbi:hypothetical protein GGX14DRAFT_394413 [Mycena pura]|uniref:Uncharacterized protein n=1 Tax=Mycena pura TaxID=153505 RepID=A0AAD6VEW3_9AGAR|nr:hypothetical protein GGX14DRAFT_394413 [Mycena pura]